MTLSDAAWYGTMAYQADTPRLAQGPFHETELHRATEMMLHEYDAMRAEERDRMNGRLTIWMLYLSLVSAFGFVALVQAERTPLAYLPALLPMLLACLARHSGHSEEVLRQLRRHLRTLEHLCGHASGYEHTTGRLFRSSHGGHLKALRDAFFITDVLVTLLVLWRMHADMMPFLFIVLVMVFEDVVICLTAEWLFPGSLTSWPGFPWNKSKQQ